MNFGKKKQKQIMFNKINLTIFANDVQISKASRFDVYKDKIKKCTPHEVIKNPSIIFE